MDPISDQFAFVSVYNYAENSPVGNIDLHGLQGVPSPYLAGEAWMIEQMYPERANGLYESAKKYLKYSGAGTIAGGAVWAIPAASAEAYMYFMMHPEAAPIAGQLIWGLGTDADIPGTGFDDITRYGRQAAGSLSGRQAVGSLKGGGGGSLNKIVQGVNKSSGEYNCASCAHAVEQRLSGNLSATSLPDGDVDKYYAKSFIESIYGRPTNITMKFGDIVGEVTSLGEGAKGIVIASGGGGRVGHAFNVSMQNGSIRILDGQAEKIFSIGQFGRYLDDISKNSTYYFYNTTKK